MPAKNKSNEIRIARIYDAMVKDVWEAWADPKAIAKWWGSDQTRVTVTWEAHGTWSAAELATFV